MSVEVISIDLAQPDPAVIAYAVRVMLRGDLVAFPTETVYGLAAFADDAEHIASVFRAKGRPSNNPLIAHYADLPHVRGSVPSWNPLRERLGVHFWPGPLSMVVPRPANISLRCTAGGETVAIRVPRHTIAKALIQATGRPIAAPSANSSNQISPTRAEHVVSSLGDRIQLVLDAGPCGVGVESTVLDTTATPAVILRPGMITAAMLSSVAGVDVVYADAQTHRTKELRSPGQLSTHYAPRAPLYVVSTAELHESIHTTAHTGFVLLEGTTVAESVSRAHVKILARDSERYAQELYAALHALDAMNVARIVVEAPPEQEVWTAVRDRLRRAAHASRG